MILSENLTALIGLGRESKAGLAGRPQTVHPDDDRLSGVYGTIFVNRSGPCPTGRCTSAMSRSSPSGQVDELPWSEARLDPQLRCRG